MSEPRLLCVDSATGISCVGVVGGGALLAQRVLREKRRHAELICDCIDEVLNEAGVALAELDAMAVGLGPGSFIGVRIAVATAKGLALGAGLPLVGVSTLAAAALAGGVGGRVAVAIDAKKGQVYAAVFDIDTAGVPGVEVLAPVALDPGPCAARFAELGPLDALLGDGVERFSDEFSALRAQRGPAIPTAAALGALALPRVKRADFDHPAQLAPAYARRSEAELKREWAQARST